MKIYKSMLILSIAILLITDLALSNLWLEDSSQSVFVIIPILGCSMLALLAYFELHRIEAKEVSNHPPI